MAKLCAWPLYAVVALQSSPACASSVIPLSFNEVVARADLIIQARIVEGSTRTVIRADAPWTCETLEISKTIKGSAEEQTNLCFLGGKLLGENYTVTDTVIPEEGLEGFFFLHEAMHNYTNPIVGWTQGAYYIADISGRKVVTTIDHAPILRIDSSLDASRSAPFAASGIVTDPKGTLSEAEFVKAIQDAGATP